MEFPPALVLDGHLNSSLTAIRSLGRKSVRILAGASRSTAMGLHSRYAHERFFYPSPLDHRRKFIDAVRDAARTCSSKPVLFTFSDATFLPLYEHRDELRDSILAVYPAHPEHVSTAFDKVRTASLASELGIETPKTELIETPSHVEHVFDPSRNGSSWTFPAVLKPRSTAAWLGDRGSQRAVQFIFSKEQAQQACHAMNAQTADLPFIQEFIHGEELGVEFLCHEGRVLAEFAHKRIRSLSPTGGASVVKQSIESSYRGIGELARRLVGALRWSGPAMVEFKVDPRDGRPKLMEINGRFWGSLPLAVFSGVDFPWLYYQLATGQQLSPPPAYKTGITSRHWLGDVLHLTKVLFRSDPMREIAYPGRASAVWNFFVPPRPLYADVASLRDPAPACLEIVDFLRRSL